MRPAGLQVGLNVLAHGERDVGVTNAHAERFPVDLGVSACIDQREIGTLREPLEPSRDRVRMRRSAVASRQATWALLTLCTWKS